MVIKHLTNIIMVLLAQEKNEISNGKDKLLISAVFRMSFALI